MLFGGGRSSAYSSTTDTSRTGLRFRGAGVRLSGSIGTNGTIGLEVNDPSRGISFAAAVLYVAMQHYVSNHDVVVISTLLFGFTARMLALRLKLGLPVFYYRHETH